MSVLGKTFNIHSPEEWAQVSHIIVNEDGLKIPVSLKDDEISAAMAYRFI